MITAYGRSAVSSIFRVCWPFRMYAALTRCLQKSLCIFASVRLRRIFLKLIFWQCPNL